MNADGLTTDQRGTGFPRTVDMPGAANAADATDIGAYELPILPPSVGKSFVPNVIPAGRVSLLTITLTNPNPGFDLTQAALTDTLPPRVTTVPGTAATTCEGEVSQTDTSVSLSGGTIPAGGSCTVTLQVTATVGGAYTNVIPASALTATAGPTQSAKGRASVVTNPAPASAVLVVVAPPTISKSFGAPTILVGGSTTLTFDLTAPAANTVALSSVSFTDALPAGLQVANPPNVVGSCGGTVTGLAGAATVSRSGGGLTPGAMCQITVSVTGVTLGVKDNSVQVTSTNGGMGNTAQAGLTVVAAPTVPALFIVGPRFVRETMRGQFGGATVVLEGCDSLSSAELAQAFVERGAGTVIGRDGLVESGHKDRALLSLTRRRVVEGVPAEQAVARLRQDLGPDPVFRSHLTLYHPAG